MSSNAGRTLAVGLTCVLLSAALIHPAAAGVKCAIVQFSDLHPDEVELDAARLEQYVREAAANGARLIVAPENCLHRYGERERNGVTQLDLAGSFDALVARFSSLADELHVCIAFGLREPSGDPDKPTYQSAVFIDHNGELLKIYRKRRPSSGEAALTKGGGEDWEPFETPFGRCFMQVCKDMDGDGYVNEMPADIDLLIGLNKDPGRGWVKVDAGCEHAGCYGVGANWAGDARHGGGNSGFVGPDGNVISEAGSGEKIVYATLPLPVGPLKGQVMVDPANPAWLVYNRDLDGDGRLDPFYMCGPGDPEDFLYRGERGPDGTRDGDQLELIAKLRDNGGNCIYLQAVRSHGGDGKRDHNPFIDSDPGGGLDPDILNQWEEWFEQMDESGIVIFFFFYDDSARIWDTSDAVGPDERGFIEGMVTRFEHHRHLIWCVAEESEERYSRARVRSIADAIRRADDHAHVIADHHHSGTEFKAYGDGCALAQFAFQLGGPMSARELHANVVDAWTKAAGRYNLNMSEHADHGYGTREDIRRKDWACALGGAHSMVLRMNIADTPVEQLRDCRLLRRFMEATDFNTMAPHDELAAAGTEYVLADPGHSYIAYTSDGSADIGLKVMPAGSYTLRWFDCVTGESTVHRGVAVAAGEQSWKKPQRLGAEVAVHITREE